MGVCVHVFLPCASAEIDSGAEKNRQHAGAALIGQEDVEIAPQILGGKCPLQESG
jgi:hypothetical protein